jgi:FG-GAP repeat protein
MGLHAAQPLRRLAPALALFLIVPGAARALSLFPNPVYPVGFLPYSVVSADLNGDGRPDLVSVNHETGDLSILLAREGGGIRSGGARRRSARSGVRCRG